MVRIEIGAGAVLTALGALGFLVQPIVAWMLLGLGIVLMFHGGLETMKLRLRWPWYRLTLEQKTTDDSKRPSLPLVDFYETRHVMAQATGGLRADLQNCARAWCAFESGQHLMALNEQLRQKVDRLILAAPDSVGLDSMLEMIGDKDDPATYPPSIRQATHYYSGRVRWAEGRFLNVVLCDPTGDDAWARIQVYLPGHEAEEWPNIIVRKRNAPALYQRVQDAYEALWNTSKSPEIQETAAPTKSHIRLEDHKYLVQKSSHLHRWKLTVLGKYSTPLIIVRARAGTVFRIEAQKPNTDWNTSREPGGKDIGEIELRMPTMYGEYEVSVATREKEDVDITVLRGVDRGPDEVVISKVFRAE